MNHPLPMKTYAASLLGQQKRQVAVALS